MQNINDKKSFITSSSSFYLYYSLNLQKKTVLIVRVSYLIKLCLSCSIELFFVSFAEFNNTKRNKLIAESVILFDSTLNPTSDFVRILQSDHSLFNFAIFHHDQHRHGGHIEVIGNVGQFIDVNLRTMWKILLNLRNLILWIGKCSEMYLLESIAEHSQLYKNINSTHFG